MSTVTILTAVFCLIIGATVLWANPHRLSNRVFFGASLLTAGWQFAVFMAIRAHESMQAGNLANPLPWIHANAAIAAFIPAAIAMLKETLLDSANTNRAIRRSLPWLALGGLLIPLCYTKSFVVENSTDYRRSVAYVAYNVSISAAFLILFVQSCRQIRAQAGIQRLELQLLTRTLGTLGLLLAILNLIGNWFQIREIRQASIPVIFAAYCFLAWAITHHRIFDARQVFRSLAQRVTLFAVLSSCVYGLWQLGGKILPAPVDLVVSVTLSCSAAFWLDRRTREWLRLDGEELLGEWRAAVLATARTEPDPGRLAAKFEQLLCQLCQSSSAAILFNCGKTYAAGQIEFAADRPGLAELAETGWATPENIQRRRPRPGLDDLLIFFRRHSLGVLVTSSRGVPSPSFLLAVGAKTTRWPFTYPEVRRLQTIAELMDNIISHARLTTQAALKAKMEHLALMSRGLAHDLKNLITPISSFLVHTEGRLDSASVEADVHRAAQRSVRLMTDYVREALFFSERLQPHFEQVDLQKVFTDVQEQTASVAAQRQVTVRLPAQAAISLVADRVLLQRMLGNLVRNAIEACEPGGEVRLLGSEPHHGSVRIQVIDDGCGIRPKDLPRIFDAYFTTKQFGNDVRGFGLGLAITEKIVHLHQGTISVHSETGLHTTMTVEIPATQSARDADPYDRLPNRPLHFVNAP